MLSLDLVQSQLIATALNIRR